MPRNVTIFIFVTKISCITSGPGHEETCNEATLHHRSVIHPFQCHAVRSVDSLEFPHVTIVGLDQNLLMCRPVSVSVRQ